jgi:tellurite resistance protein
MESPHLQVFRVWAALAWADGVIAKSEAAAIQRLVRGSSLSEDEKGIALGFLDKRPEYDAQALASLSSDAREGIYKAAVRLAALDGVFADGEKDFLMKLRGALSLSTERAEEIEKSSSPPPSK